MGVPKIEYLNENLTWQLDRNIGEIEINLVFSFEYIFFLPTDRIIQY